MISMRHMTTTEPASGTLWIVGAGPGDPDLLTIKALRVIERAEVLVYDKLVAQSIVNLAPADAVRIFVGKTRGHHSLPQEDINSLLVQQALAGRQVVRLKGGDPFIFGRGGEELAAARAAGVTVEIIPGITAALGCAAQTHIPLTHRDHASCVTFVTGQCRDLGDQNWCGLAGPRRTLVVYMGLNGAEAITTKLISEGLATSTPVAVIENGTRSNARYFTATLATLAPLVAHQNILSPALLIIGDVAALAKESTLSLLQHIAVAA